MSAIHETLEQLVEKYFEGLTTCEEEKELRRLFAETEVPESLEVYRPLFAYLESESKSAQEEHTQQNNVSPIKQKRFRLHPFISIAAGMLLILGISGIWHTLYSSSDAVWIDGKRYTDQALVQQQAQAAFHAVSFTEEDILLTLFEE